MRQFCTLFDRNYLAKGLCLHSSLIRHCTEPFILHILAMDTETQIILDELALPSTRVITLPAFEKALQLEGIKQCRTWAEYCWTCGSSLMEYLLSNPDMQAITYLDSDLMFFSDPAAVFLEMGERSISIIPHRFPDHKKYMEGNGIYNVGWVSAKATPHGRACIARWSAQCREWCFNRQEDGKFGDQSYLDTWPTDYPGEVAVIENLGAGLAPWNIAEYAIENPGDHPTVDGVPVVFYHYHEFAGYNRLTGYRMRAEDLSLIYAPYLVAWEAANQAIAQVEKVRRDRQQAIAMQAESA